MRRAWCALLLLLAAAWVAWAPRVGAAPVGARRIDRGRYTVIHYAGDAVLAATMLDAAVTRDTFPWLPRSSTRILIMVAPDAVTFREWAGQSAFPWSAALAFVDQDRVVVQGHRAPGNAGDPLQVLRHELAHIALHDYLGDLPPRWFDEGYASYAAGEERTEGFLQTNAALVFRAMPTLAALDTMLSNSRATDARAGYALALRAVTDLANLDRERGLAPLLSAWKERQSFDLAIRRAYALTSEQFERRWQQQARWQFAFLSLAADSAIVVAACLLLLGPLYRRRRREQRERLAAMREREAITERAARSQALDMLLQSIGPSGAPPSPDA